MPQQIIEDMYDRLYKENEQNKKQITQLTNNWNELEELINIQLKIAEENIIESTKWLEIEEEKEHAKNDIHTAKIIKRYMLGILDKMKEIKEENNK